MPDTDTPSATTEIDVDASPEDVWRALSTDEGIEAWLGEGATIDPTPGGEIRAPDPATGVEREGTVVESTDADRRLRYRWWPVSDPASPSSVTIDVVPTVHGTRVIVVERPEVPLTAIASASNSSCAAISSRSGAAWEWRAALLRLRIDLTIRA